LRGETGKRKIQEVSIRAALHRGKFLTNVPRERIQQAGKKKVANQPRPEGTCLEDGPQGPLIGKGRREEELREGRKGLWELYGHAQGATAVPQPGPASGVEVLGNEGTRYRGRTRGKRLSYPR